MLARTVFLLFILGVRSPAQPALPTAAAALAVTPSPGVTLKFHFLAVGKQIYKCDGGAWSKASTPDATLFDMNAKPKIHHGAGPSWTMLAGKSTVKAIAPTAVHFASPDGIAIDWLKLDVDKTAHTGEFKDVTVVQRLYTGGGKAPASACTANQVFESPYTAHYYFWAAR